MKIKKSILCILIAIAFFIIFPSESKAMSQKEAGETIAKFAINFANNYGKETYYSLGGCNGANYNSNTESHRAYAYRGIKTSGTAYKSTNNRLVYNGEFQNKYAMDCVGLVSFAIHNSLGLGDANSFTVFISPQNPHDGANDWMERVNISSRMPGDIIKSSGHVMVYTGVGADGREYIVDSTSGNINGVSYRALPATYAAHSTYRLKASKVANIPKENTTIDFLGKGGVPTVGCAASYNGFMYDGIQGGVYGDASLTGNWVIEKLSEVLDWIIGLQTYLTKVQVVGWSNIVESFVNSTMEKITGLESNITIEKIIYNKVPFLDVNVFNFKAAGGEELKPDSIIYLLRQNIAQWYYAVRLITIIGLLATLIYIGIRMAMSTVASDRAKYKGLLVNWIVSFIIVFTIHYIMVGILSLNEALVDVMHSGLGGETSVYDSIRSQAYDVKASTGWPAAILYACLVYLLIKFIFAYIKRLMVIDILTLMGPVVAIGYSIDKIKDNKSQSLSNWLKEYFFNVIVQSVHTLLYVSLVTISFNVIGSSLIGGFLSILLIRFILEAEKIFKKIFNIKSGQLQDILSSTAAVFGGLAVAKKMSKKAVKLTGAYFKPITYPVKRFTSNLVKQTDTYKKFTNNYNSIMVDSDKDSKTVSKVKGLLNDVKGWKADDLKNVAGKVTGTVVGIAETAVGIPVAIMNPEAGAGVIVDGISGIKKGLTFSDEEKMSRAKRDERNSKIIHSLEKANNAEVDLIGEYNRLQDNGADMVAVRKVMKNASKVVSTKVIEQAIIKVDVDMETDISAIQPILLQVQTLTGQDNLSPVMIKNIEKMVREQITREQNVNGIQKTVTTSQVISKFTAMSEKNQKKIIGRANTITRKVERSQINEVIDNINKDSKFEVSKKDFMKNFDQTVKEIMLKEKGIEINGLSKKEINALAKQEKITKVEMEDKIALMSTKKLAELVQKVSIIEGSMNITGNIKMKNQEKQKLVKETKDIVKDINQMKQTELETKEYGFGKYVASNTINDILNELI